MPLKLHIHNDDYGLTKGITDNILTVIDHGAVNSASIFPNGYAFDYAVKEYQKRRNFRLSIHLNLAEGNPLSPVGKVHTLINEEGKFCYTFLQLWQKYLLASPETKELMRQQVRLELAAQIKKAQDALNLTSDIQIDSHIHYHMIPFVFDALLDVAKDFPVSYIRIPEEPFFLALKEEHWIKNYFGPNILKHYLVNHLARDYKTRLSRMNISSCDFFIGLLFTGNISLGVIQSALMTIKRIAPRGSLVEILLHPGGAEEQEKYHWRNQKYLLEYYYSPWRQREFELLTSDALKQFLKGHAAYATVSGH